MNWAYEALAVSVYLALMAGVVRYYLRPKTRGQWVFAVLLVTIVYPAVIFITYNGE